MPRTITLGGHSVTSVIGELSDSFPTRALSQITGIAVHHDAGFFDGKDKNMNGTTVDEEHSRIKAVHRMHTQDNGWGGIAYHLYVFPSGRIWQVGTLTTVRAHVAYRNHDLAGIVLAGDFTTHDPALGLLLGTANAIDAINKAVGKPLPYKGHREWAVPGWESQCPGNSWQRWIRKPHEILVAQNQDTLATKAIADALRPNVEAGNLDGLADQIAWLTGQRRCKI